MKTFLFAALALSATATATQAAGPAAPCKLVPVMSCTAKGAPDLVVEECGSKYSLNQYMHGKLVSDTPAKFQPPNPKTPGAPTVYQGAGVSLSIALTTAPLKGGGHEGHLKGKIGGAKVDGTYTCAKK